MGGREEIFFLFFVFSVGFCISSSSSCFLTKAPRSGDFNKEKKCVFVTNFNLNQNIIVALRCNTTAQFHIFLGYNAFLKPYGA